MMELRVSGPELQTLLEMGVLTSLIDKCTVAGPETEEPKKKKTSRKKKEESQEEKPAAAQLFEAKAEHGLPEAPTEQPCDPTVPPMEAPNLEPAPTAVPEPVKEEKLSLESLAQKAIGLMDSGKGAELQALLQQFGANSLPELQPEQYGGFYAALVEMEG